MPIVIAAGGTGGHIIPAIAVAEAVRRKQAGAEVVFIGVGKKIEELIVLKKRKS